MLRRAPERPALPDCLLPAAAGAPAVPIDAVTAGRLAGARWPPSIAAPPLGSAPPASPPRPARSPSSRTRKAAIASVLFGLGERRWPRPPLLSPASCPARCPPGTYRLGDGFDDPALAALAFALGAYRFTRYRADDGRAAPPRPARRRRRRRRRRASPTASISPATSSTPPPTTSAPPNSPTPPRDLAAPSRRRRSPRSSATRCSPTNFPLIHAVGAAATPERAPRLIDLAWGDPGHPKVTSSARASASTPAASTSSRRAGMLLMKKDMGGAANALGLAHMIMDAGLHGPPARPHPGGRERHLRRRLPARRRLHEPQGPDRRDRQHRRRGPPGPRRRAGARRRGGARPPRRSRDADRRRPRRARPRGRAVLHRTTTRSPPISPATAPRSPIRSGACRSGRRTRSMLDSKVADINNAGSEPLRRLDHRRAVPVALRARRRRAGCTPTSSPGTRRRKPGKPGGRRGAGDPRALRAAPASATAALESPDAPIRPRLIRVRNDSPHGSRTCPPSCGRARRSASGTTSSSTSSATTSRI